MNATINVERPCTIIESIQKSCQEVKLMREGKIPKRSWEDFSKQMKDEIKKEDNNIPSNKEIEALVNEYCL